MLDHGVIDEPIKSCYFWGLDGVLALQMDSGDCHWLMMEIRKLSEWLTIDPVMAELVRLAYERTPCSHCRNNFYATLKSNGLVSEAMEEEFSHDCLQYGDD